MKISLYLATVVMVIMLCTMSSCMSSRKSKTQLTNKSLIENEHYSDSLVYIEKIVIDTIVTPTETLQVNVPKLGRDTVIVYRNGRASTTISYKKGELSLNTQCDSLSQLVLHKSSELTRLKQQLKASEKQEITAESEVKSPVLGGNWLIWWNGILILILLVLMVIQIVKR